MTPRILAFAGSLRRDSFNKKIVPIAATAARDAGAVCDQILTTTPGVGYVCEDGTAEPVRVRAFHVTDADIDYLTAQFAPGRRTSER